MALVPNEKTPPPERKKRSMRKEGTSERRGIAGLRPTGKKTRQGEKVRPVAAHQGRKRGPSWRSLSTKKEEKYPSGRESRAKNDVDDPPGRGKKGRHSTWGKGIGPSGRKKMYRFKCTEVRKKDAGRSKKKQRALD